MIQPFTEPTSAYGGHLLANVAHPKMPILKQAFLVRRTEASGPVGFLEFLDSCTDEFVDFDLKPSDPAVASLSLNLEKLWCPKIIELPHETIINCARWWEKKFPDSEELYFPYPWYMGIGVPYDILCGRTRTQIDLFYSPDKYLDTHLKLIKAGLVSMTILTPGDVFHVVDNLADKQAPPVKNLICGGAQMTQESVARFHKFSKNVYVYYASSECLYVTAHLFDKSVSYENYHCGTPRDDIQVKILDDDYNEVPRGKHGQIVVKTNTAFTRYIGEPEMTKRSWMKDGWYLTKDGGYMREDGDLFVFGRRGDHISRGVILTPVGMIEKPIKALPDVLEVKAIPVPDALNGENTCACIVTRPGSNLTSEEVIEHVANSMTRNGAELYPVDYVVPFQDSIVGKSKQELIAAAVAYLKIDVSK